VERERTGGDRGGDHSQRDDPAAPAAYPTWTLHDEALGVVPPRPAGAEGRRGSAIGVAALPFRRLWTLSLPHLRDAVPGVQLP